MVKEFSANLEDRVDDKVFAKGNSINMSNEAIKKLIGAPDHEEDDHSILMDEGVEIVKLVKKLCHVDKEVVWAIGNNNPNINFKVGALITSWTPLFKLISSGLIPSTHLTHYSGQSNLIVCHDDEKEGGCQIDYLPNHY